MDLDLSRTDIQNDQGEIEPIFYQDSFKYRLTRTHRFMLPIQVGVAPDIGYFEAALGSIRLYPNGLVVILKGYPWDGPSGLAIDDATAMTGSLRHDALHDLIREGILDEEPWREIADMVYRHTCKSRGMIPLRADIHFEAIREFGDNYIDPREEHSAP